MFTRKLREFVTKIPLRQKLPRLNCLTLINIVGLVYMVFWMAYFFIIWEWHTREVWLAVVIISAHCRITFTVAFDLSRGIVQMIHILPFVSFLWTVMDSVSVLFCILLFLLIFHLLSEYLCDQKAYILLELLYVLGVFSIGMVYLLHEMEHLVFWMMCLVISSRKFIKGLAFIFSE